MSLTNLGEHKATVIIELADGTIIQKCQRFSSGNPLFHASAAKEAVDVSMVNIEKMIASEHGDIRDRK